MAADLSIVIPTLGRPILERCLDCIAAGTMRPAKVIVVDQGANPEVRRWLDAIATRGLKSEHLTMPRSGRAAGVNRGLRAVETGFAAITDDDCLVDESWIECLARRLRTEPGAVITGRVEPLGAETIVAVVTSLQEAVYRRPGLAPRGTSGGNMAVALSLIERVGLFDEDPRLRTAEDSEWSYRVLRAGIPIIYAPEVVVRHVGWREEGQRSEQYRDYARSHGGFYGKYLRRGDLLIALRVLVHHGRAARRWARGLLRGDRDMAAHGRAYLTGLLPGIIAGLRRRPPVP